MNCSLRENILQYNQPVPRYTSYPTAPNFKPADITQNPYADIKSTDTVSLYIHIPFCEKMCFYCGCNTKITKQYDPINNYVYYLLREIRFIAQQQKNILNVSHIHFGGGSPGILTPEDFTAIMTEIKNHYNVLSNAEIAIELDPRGVTEDRVKAYATMGINRVSLGVQDFNDDVLDSVNRSQPFNLSYDAVNLLRKYGINHFNFDLIYGLPHQTTQKMERTIDLALSLNPHRISLFGYAHVPWVKKHMRLIDESQLPDESLRLDLFETGANILEEKGYIPIGIDHFVKPDDTMARAYKNKTLTRNFQGYTTDTSTNMIGLGVSSIGKTESNFYQNYSDMPVYKNAIDNNEFPIGKSCEIQDKDKVMGRIIKDLMCYFETDLAHYEGDFAKVLEQIKLYQDAGFITINDSKITILKAARPVARIICAAFDEYLPINIPKRHSKSV